MRKLFITFIAVFTGITAMYAQNAVEVSFKELPKDVQKYISKNFEGYAIDKASQELNQKGNVNFTDVYISKGTEKMKLVFDKKGEFVKKEPIAAAAAAAPKKPADTTAAPKQPADTTIKQ